MSIWTSLVREGSMQQPIQFKLILPADVKAWLAAESAKNIRSQGSEIVACLREQMARTDLQTNT